MYSSSIPLRYLKLRIDRQADLYHQVMAYDNIIAYSRLTFFVINMKAMINYLAARKFQHGKSHFNFISCSVHASGYTVIYFIRPHLLFIIFCVLSLYHAVGSSAIPLAY